MISKKKNLKKQKGFSLVEVLCAIALLALVAAPVIQVIFSSLSVNAKSRKLLAATDLSSAIVEYISANAFEDYQVGPSGSLTTVTGVRKAYYGTDASLDPKSLSIYDGTKYYTYKDTNLSGPVGDNASLMSFSGKLKVSGTETYTGKKLYINNVSYSGYNFDVCISILKNDSIGTKKYFCYDCFVEVLDPAQVDGDGNVIEPSKSIINTHTCVPNTLDTK